ERDLGLRRPRPHQRGHPEHRRLSAHPLPHHELAVAPWAGSDHGTGDEPGDALPTADHEGRRHVFRHRKERRGLRERAGPDTTGVHFAMRQATTGFWLRAATLLALASWSLVASAQVPATITACIQKSSGQLRIVSASDACSSSETRVSWSAAGIKGPN